VGRNFTFLIVGIAVGLVIANFAKHVSERKNDDQPDVIQDKISDRLEFLERQLSS